MKKQIGKECRQSCREPFLKHQHQVLSRPLIRIVEAIISILGMVRMEMTLYCIPSELANSCVSLAEAISKAFAFSVTLCA